MQTIKTVLTAARELVAKGWTQTAYAVDARGSLCDLRSSDAVKWCMLGAIIVASGDDEAVERDARIYMRLAIGEYLTFFNDAPDRTQAEVLAAFDKAIANAPDAREAP